jgi:hypothetical protein
MIWIIQLLCPSRHAIMGCAYDESETPHDQAMTMFQTQMEKLITSRVLRQECGICKATDLKYERARTKFHNMQEAAQSLRNEEAAQAASRVLLDAVRRAERN